MCHSGKSHYELEQCSSCHSDTHAPLHLKIEGEVTGPCLTCHHQQGDEVTEHPSAHTDLPCNECHAAHREVPSCMECHEKHTEGMNFKACVSCHPVHMPLAVTYTEEDPLRNTVERATRRLSACWRRIRPSTMIWPVLIAIRINTRGCHRALPVTASPILMPC